MGKIVIDILGGDNAPYAMLDGVAIAAKKDKDLNFVLIGDDSIVAPFVAQQNLSNRVEIVHSKDSISNEEAPTAVKSRPESSIALGMECLRRREDCVAFVSAGSTGAILAGGVLKLGRVPGLSRPGIAPLFPTKIPGQKVLVIDVGANVDCRPEHLLHFAIAGSEYMKTRGIMNPRVALVNVGVEEKKGNELTSATHEMLRKSDLNFLGNMEAREAFSGDYDVLVCDGFVGNVLLKTAEGAMKLVMTHVKRKLSRGFFTKLGAFMVRGKLQTLRKELGEEEVGGSIFLGLKKPVVKAHGNSRAHSFASAILLASKSGEGELGENIRLALERNSLQNEKSV